MSWFITHKDGSFVAAAAELNTQHGALIRLSIVEGMLSHFSNHDQPLKAPIVIDSIRFSPEAFDYADQSCVLWRSENFLKTNATNQKSHVEQLNFFETIFNNIPTDIAIFSADHRYLFVNSFAIHNPEMRKWIIGKTDYDYCDLKGIGHELADLRHDRFKEAVTSQTKVEWVDEVRSGTEPKFIHRRFTPIAVNNQVLYVVGIGYDVTNIYKLNAELELSRNNYKAIFEQNMAGIFTSTFDGKFLAVNKEFCRTFGYEEDELLRYNASIIYLSPEDRRDYVYELQKNRKLANYEMRLRKKDGSVVYALCNISISPRTEGEIIQGTLIDITEYKKALETVEMLSSIPRTNTNPVIKIDSLSGETLYANLSAQEMMQNADDLTQLHELYQTIVQSDLQSTNYFETTLQGIDFQVNAVREAESHSVNLHFADITARKNALRDRDQSIDELTRLNTNLLQFNYIVSHNLRSPISNIKGLLSILKSYETKFPEDSHEVLEHLYTSVGNLDQVMNDLNMLLDLRRNANPRESLIHLDEFVESILKNFADVIQSKQALVHASCPNSALVYTQPSLLNSILFNLLSNALKYTSPKRQPEIKIACALSDDFVRIAISDNGLGLDLKRYGDQLFTPFRRFHANTEGKGLGLNMVKTQVEMLGGTIHVESTVDVGSTFTVTLPLETKPEDSRVKTLRPLQ
jgi:PAS domain S-box-containing protein